MLIQLRSSKSLSLNRYSYDYLCDIDGCLPPFNNYYYVQHNMDGYRRSVFRSYLEKQPDKYSGPDQTQATKEIKEVSLLIPEVECVEFHELYPKGYTIDVEGNNLWFCHKVHIGNTSIIATAVQNITRRSIQFNFIPPNGEKFAVPDNGHIEITLHSRFTPPIRELRATVKQVCKYYSLLTMAVGYRYFVHLDIFPKH